MIPFEREPRPQRDPRREEEGDLGGRLRRASDLRSKPGAMPAAQTRAAALSRRARRELAGWLVGPLLLCATAAGVLLVLRGPDQLFAVAFGLVLALGLVWIVVSALFPARPDRICPSCGREALERIDPRSLMGLRCRACAWRDATASGFVHAEDDGEPLEDLVLRERGERRRFRRW